MRLPVSRSRGFHRVLVLLPLCLAALLPSPAFALITQGFRTTEPLVVGSLVSLSTTEPNTVRAGSVANAGSLYGVVTAVADGTAQVATSELVPALVSTGNGDISVGSPITASELKGVGERATTSIRIVGFAQAPFNAKVPTARIEKVKDHSGRTRALAFGAIPVMLGAANYVAVAGTRPGENAEGTWIPTPVQSFFASIAGHQVVPSRVILSLFLLLVVVVIIGMLVGTAVHSSVISIGRNPLASHSLLKALMQVVVVAIALMAGAMGAVYVIVTR